jgi:diguanylate cyclase (GGDEF)-like protein
METSSLGTFDWQYDRQGRQLMLTSNVITMSENGQVKGAICASIDVTERRRTEKQLTDYAQSLAIQAVELEAANRKLNHLAITDGLTGLWNHRRFHEVLNTRLAEFEKIGVPFSLILLDIDFFKKVNDRLGHQEGDQVLRHFAQTLKENSREAEAPFRYGGEEFAILLRNCDEQKSIDAAARFCQLIRSHPWSHWAMTASFGVATIRPGATSRSIISEADQALYAAKHGGRDQAIHWNSIESNEPHEELISA